MFNRSKDEKDVVFIDASRAYDDSNTQLRLRQQDIQNIATTFRARIAVDRYASVAPVEVIKSNDFNLNIPRYVDTSEEQETIDVALLQSVITKLETERQRTKDRLDAYLQELGYGS